MDPHIHSLADAFEVDLRHLLESRLDGLTIEAQGVDGEILWRDIRSGANLYHVWRFLNMAGCNCAAAQYGRRCRHLAIVFPPVCRECGQITVRFGICRSCEVRNTPYLKPVIKDAPPRVKIGGIWV